MKNNVIRSTWTILSIALFFLFSCASTQQKQGERGDARFYHNWGDDHYRKGEYDRAISNYNKALEIDPRNDAVYLNRGNAYARKGQYDQAISDYGKALEIDPKKEAVYFFRGNANFNKKEYDQAISDYSKALEINPRHALVYFNRGVAHGKKGQYDQAISDYNKALEIDPKHFRACNNLAWIFATAKDPNFRDGKMAVEFASKACELSGWKEPNCLGTLAAAYARVGDFENAVKWQEKALEDPQFAKEAETQERLKFYKDRKPWPPD